MKRTNIHLSDETRKWLRSHGEAVGLHPAAIVRRAIDEYRERQSRRAEPRGHRPLTGERRKPKR